MVDAIDGVDMVPVGVEVWKACPVHVDEEASYDSSSITFEWKTAGTMGCLGSGKLIPSWSSSCPRDALGGSTCPGVEDTCCANIVVSWV